MGPRESGLPAPLASRGVDLGFPERDFMCVRFRG